MRLTGHETLKFDSILPMYNWIHPLSGTNSIRFRGRGAAFAFNEVRDAKSRALYIHIPFCQTICTFCPFVRATDQNPELVNVYVDALIEEIRIKASIPALTRSPIGAVFFGGGTPSFLSSEQILKIGNALKASFDLSACREYSFEVEVKSATRERIDAMKEIGVTHARFGAQTFSPYYRAIFNLTASVEEVKGAAELLKNKFNYVSCDMLYGMNGQSPEEVALDIDDACSMGLDNMDFYPINNISTQPKLHRKFRQAGAPPTSGLTKHYMNILVRECLYEKGYLPHNGHGYVKVGQQELDAKPVLTNSYSFSYHEHTLGYLDYDLLGFGVNAISSFNKYSAFNTESRDIYIRSLKDGVIPTRITEHSEEIDACRPLALALPYHGEIPKHWVNWGALSTKTKKSFHEAMDHGLIFESDEKYLISMQGWQWYTSLMYYLLPSDEQNMIKRIVHAGAHDPKRDIEGVRLNAVNIT